jgi:hypothetical protein
MFFGVFSVTLRKQRWYVYWFGGRDVTVDADGIHVANLSSAAKRVLVDAMTNTTLQQLRTDTLQYEKWNDAMRRICVQAFYEQGRNAFSSKHPVTAFIMQQKADLQRWLPISVDTTLEKFRRQMTRDGSTNELDAWVLDQQHYDPDDIKKAAKGKFRVAELQMEAIRMNWKEDDRPTNRRFSRQSGSNSLSMLKRAVSFSKASSPKSAKKVYQEPDASEGRSAMLWATTSQGCAMTKYVVPVSTQQDMISGPEQIKKAKAERAILMKALQCKEEELAALKRKMNEEHVRLPIGDSLLPGEKSPETRVPTEPEPRLTAETVASLSSGMSLPHALQLASSEFSEESC